MLYFGVPYGMNLILMGAGTVIAGLGTLLQKGPLAGTTGASRNPIAPWNVVFGRAKVGGTIVYISEFDDDNKYLDVVIVTACHPIQSFDALLFDGQRLPLDANGCSVSPPDDQTGPNITSIVRSNGVVTVAIASPITDPAGGALQTDDTLIIKNVGTDLTLNGKFTVTVIDSTHFYYICGGTNGAGSGGQTETTWPNYKAKVHAEFLLGDHSATFPGMLTGTPYDGDPGNLVVRPNNPWTANHKLLGKACAFLRLHYNDKIFANGLPTIHFRLSGKKDVYDPRSNTGGYSENAALCTADYLSNTTWGFRAVYHTEIPDAGLIAAANICDELVDLAVGGKEPRYTCNGGFPLTMKRGEVIQNLLTSCGGRLTYVGGQWVIHPAACVGVSASIGAPLPDIVRPCSGIIVPGTAFCSGQGTIFASCDSITPSTGHILRWCFSGLSSPAAGAFYDFFVPNPELLTKATLTVVFSGGKVNSGPTPPVGSPPNTDSTYDAELLITFDGVGQGSGTIYDLGDTGTTTVVVDLQQRAVNIQKCDWSALFVEFSVQGSLTSAFDAWAGNEINIDDVYLTLTYDTSGVVSSDPGGTALDQATGPFKWRQKLAIRDLYNGVKGTYISPANNWQSSDIPPYAQDELHGYHSGSPEYPEGDANMAADGGDRRWKDIQLPFTISCPTAQRLCKIELLRNRMQGTGTFMFNMAMYRLKVLDVIQMGLPVLGWVAKTLEIQQHRFTLNKQQQGGSEVTLLGTEIDVQEYDCSIFDWSTSEELTAQGFQQAAMPSNVDILKGITTDVNKQTGTTYTVQESDRGQLISLSNTNPVAVTLPQAGELQNQLPALWNAWFQNTNSGAVTITPSGGSTIDGQSSLTLLQNNGVHIFSDGTNFYTERGMATDGSGYVIDAIVANAITPDLAKARSHEVILNQATQITINNPTFGGTAVPAGTEFRIIITQDGTGGRPTPAWGSNYTGVTGFEIGGDVNSRNTFRFVTTAAGKFSRSGPPDINII